MTPEELIGEAAAKELAKHYDLTPKARPLPEVVTMEDVQAFWQIYDGFNGNADASAFAALSHVIPRWLRARLETLPTAATWLGDGYAFTDRVRQTTLNRADTFKALTNREWSEK